MTILEGHILPCRQFSICPQDPQFPGLDLKHNRSTAIGHRGALETALGWRFGFESVWYHSLKRGGCNKAEWERKCPLSINSYECSLFSEPSTLAGSASFCSKGVHLSGDGPVHRYAIRGFRSQYDVGSMSIIPTVGDTTVDQTTAPASCSGCLPCSDNPFARKHPLLKLKQISQFLSLCAFSFFLGYYRCNHRRSFVSVECSP